MLAQASSRMLALDAIDAEEYHETGAERRRNAEHGQNKIGTLSQYWDKCPNIGTLRKQVDFLRRRFPDTFQDSGAISPTAAATQNNSRRSFNPIQQEQPGDTGLREQAGVPTQPQPSRTTIV